MPEYALDEWRAIMRGEKPQPSDDYIVIAFPNDEIRIAYLSQVSSWPEMEVRAILRKMLGGPSHLSVLDQIHLQVLKAEGPSRSLDPDAPDERHFSEYEGRAILAAAGRSSEPVWQGISWVLDLLPDSPRDALGAVSAYFMAHFQVLSDWREVGLSDAIALIRHRYITQGRTERERKIKLLRSLDPRDLEFLIADLYRVMGYTVRVTPRQKDGGKDIEAERGNEKIYIECKNWEQKVDVNTVRSFGFVVMDKNVTSGVLVSVSGFTERGPETAEKLVMESSVRHRMILLDGHRTVQQLNEYLGAGWHLRADQIIVRQKRSG
ncbi:restriction endonuclease [Streptomyces sp. NPDC001601]|uniref:restriction endonuclease n=1 Tax=Streptomyces sp. NPDC001601 TaxID=3364592 RepID=UPI0036AE0D85